MANHVLSVMGQHKAWLAMSIIGIEQVNKHLDNARHAYIHALCRCELHLTCCGFAPCNNRWELILDHILCGPQVMNYAWASSVGYIWGGEYSWGPQSWILDTNFPDLKGLMNIHVNQNHECMSFINGIFIYLFGITLLKQWHTMYVNIGASIQFPVLNSVRIFIRTTIMNMHKLHLWDTISWLEWVVEYSWGWESWRTLEDASF